MIIIIIIMIATRASAELGAALEAENGVFKPMLRRVRGFNGRDGKWKRTSVAPRRRKGQSGETVEPKNADGTTILCCRAHNNDNNNDNTNNQNSNSMNTTLGPAQSGPG